MAQIIYLVRSSGGQYEEAWTHVEHARSTEADARADCVRMETEDKAVLERDERIREVQCKWEKDNGQPEYLPRENHKPWPSGLGSKDITAEMRAARDDRDERNKIIDEANEEIHTMWDAVRRAHIVAYVMANEDMPVEEAYAWEYRWRETCTYDVVAIRLD